MMFRMTPASPVSPSPCSSALLGLLGLTLALSACGPRPVTSKFELDVCGTEERWEVTSKDWDAIGLTFLPLRADSLLGFHAPEVVKPDRPTPTPLSVQFTIGVDPTIDRPAVIAKLVRSYGLQSMRSILAEASRRKRWRESLGSDAPIEARIPPPGEGVLPLGTGTGRAFSENIQPVESAAGQLDIIEARFIAENEHSHLGVLSGQFSFEAEPKEGGAPCTVTGSFENASFHSPKR